MGLSGEERALTPWHKSIGRRLPWLYINLATAFAAAASQGQGQSAQPGYDAAEGSPDLLLRAS